MLAPKRISSGCQMRCMPSSASTCLPMAVASDSLIPGRMAAAMASTASQVRAWAYFISSGA